MLSVCRERLQALGWSERCQLVHGYIHDVPLAEQFDAAICLLVLPHTRESERKDILGGVAQRLKPGGRFIASELSEDLSVFTAGDALEDWKALIRRSGAPEDKVEQLPALMRENLSILAPTSVEEKWRANGLGRPIQFFQSFLIRAWWARKGSCH
jgi:tRNA (cmo5U34)-methyltransferase